MIQANYQQVKDKSKEFNILETNSIRSTCKKLVQVDQQARGSSKSYQLSRGQFKSIIKIKSQMIIQEEQQIHRLIIKKKNQ